MQTLYVITTGGTIEKVYSEPTGTVANVDAKIDEYLGMLRLPGLRIKTTHLMNKDSLEMTDSDRERVLQAVTKKLRRPAPVVITHGTDTLVETGLLLWQRLPRLKFPIVLTGAMTPLGFREKRWIAELNGEPACRPPAATWRLPGHPQRGVSHRPGAKGPQAREVCSSSPPNQLDSR